MEIAVGAREGTANVRFLYKHPVPWQYLSFLQSELQNIRVCFPTASADTIRGTVSDKVKWLQPRGGGGIRVEEQERSGRPLRDPSMTKPENLVGRLSGRATRYVLLVPATLTETSRRPGPGQLCRRTDSETGRNSGTREETKPSQPERLLWVYRFSFWSFHPQFTTEGVVTMHIADFALHFPRCS